MRLSYINILEDGTVLKTKWLRNPGERVLKPGTKTMLPIKYSLTPLEYQQCQINSKQKIEQYANKKAIFINRGFGFPETAKTLVIKQLFDEIKGEPLMQESFFISMIHFT